MNQSTSVAAIRFKVCPACLCLKPLTAEFFHASRTGHGKTGFVPRCKVCACLARQAYYHANAGAEKERHAEWTKGNRERVNQATARSRAKKSEYYKEVARRWRQQNKAKKRASNRARKALIKAADRECYGDAELDAMWIDQQGLCFYCKTPVFATYHIEHKTPLSRGGVDKLINICLACPACNLRKHVMTADEFMARLAQ